jgi:anion-transporting  ArsA/GET3 family ATPase
MKEDNMLNLDLTVIGQIYVEILEQYQQTSKNKFKRKSLIKQLIKELEVDTERDFNKLFELDEQTLLSIQQNYEYAIQNFAIRNIPDKIILSQMMSAYEKDPSGIEASVHRILKKK